jgi:hypothetical protein
MSAYLYCIRRDMISIVVTDFLTILIYFCQPGLRIQTLGIRIRIWIQAFWVWLFMTKLKKKYRQLKQILIKKLQIFLPKPFKKDVQALEDVSLHDSLWTRRLKSIGIQFILLLLFLN